MKKLFFVSAVFSVFLLVSCDSGKDVKRPRDPWVFRSVLDKQPRIVTATLHENLFVAYDARFCGLYKAWKGEVILDGPVYTTKHGPQPTSAGYAYFEQRLTEPAWRLRVDGTEVIPTVSFKGYSLKNNQVTFRFDLSDGKGNTVSLEESPEYTSKSGKSGLQRTFTISDATDGTEVLLKTKLTNLQAESDYKTDGTLTIDSKEEKKYANGSTITLNVTLALKSSGKTNLEVFYHPGFKGATETSAPASTDVLVQGSQLIEGSDCKTCHNEGVATVGPAYLDVAKKYANTAANVTMLAQKVIEGGSGTWGQVVMNPHPDLMQSDAEKMISYIMSLDGETLAVEKAEDVMLSMEAVPYIELKEKSAAEEKGLALSIYKIEDFIESPFEIPKTTKPVVSAKAPAVHMTSTYISQLAPEFREAVYMEFTGMLSISQTENYVLRIVSDDGSRLFLDDKLLIDNDGYHGAEAKDAELILKEGKHKIKLQYWQGRGGAAISLQWRKRGDEAFSIIPNAALSYQPSMVTEALPYVPKYRLVRSIPGDRSDEAGVHPSFDLAQARPSTFEPMVGGMDFFSDGRLAVCTWDSVGPVYILEGVTGASDPEKIKVTKVASGLAEPLGLKIVNDTLYVLQKQELTRLIDTDGDGIMDEYQTVCAGWKVSPNFHEFAFGLAYKDGYFYAALATAIEPGGASANPQIPDRGKAIKISKKDGSIEFIAHGLRTPNGVGIGVDGEIFITDNQGDWLPSSKVVHVKPGAWYGSRSVDFEGTASLTETLPVVWLPQDEIGNSPSQPVYINEGPYKGQQLHGEVTHGGLKRVFVEKVNGEYQGAVFRFTQGLEGGVNRVVWGPDGALYIGMIGNPGNWGQQGKKWYGIQKLTYNNNSTFEMLGIRAKSNGVEIEMTEPIDALNGNAASDYEVRQWYYQPTENYGGRKLNDQGLKIKSVNISDDRKKVFLELDGMKAGHVVYVRLKGIFVSASKGNLWSTEGWYTMNQIPANDPEFKSPATLIQHNVLTEKEKGEGWKLLFDGKTTAGWRNFKSTTIGSAWKVKDGALHLDNSVKKDWQVVGGGDIITEEEFENFELSIEWKLQPCGNSGVMYNVVESDEHDYVWNTGPEMQVLDNVCHPDARIEKHRAGDLYDMIATKFVTANPGGEWNYARLISNKGQVEFWLNGYKLVEFTMFTPEWTEMIKNSKFKDMKGFGMSPKGHISLQDHGDLVWFRNIKIREIK